MRTALTLLPALLALPCTIALTQPAPLTPGDRVQVTAPIQSAERAIGTVLSVHEDTLVLQMAGITDPVRLPWSGITEISVSRGRHRNVGGGMLLGGIAGVGLGAVIGFAAGDDSPGIMSLSASDKAVIGGVLVGVLGMGIGGLLGSTYKDSWERVPLGGVTARVGLTPRADGLSLHLTTRF